MTFLPQESTVDPFSLSTQHVYEWDMMPTKLLKSVPHSDRVREKCRTDRSLAIAHDLEHLCEIEPTKPKKTVSSPENIAVFTS